MGLTGPSITILVEPKEEPQYAPEPDFDTEIEVETETRKEKEEVLV